MALGAQRDQSHLTNVTHTYDFTALTNATRLEKARSTTPEMLRESMDKLAMLAQQLG